MVVRPFIVLPEKAGTQFSFSSSRPVWTPAFAGVTVKA
jgi:hypothetical protein